MGGVGDCVVLLLQSHSRLYDRNHIFQTAKRLSFYITNNRNAGIPEHDPNPNEPENTKSLSALSADRQATGRRSTKSHTNPDRVKG
ncbi:MAG: hypothetical protein MRJ65_01510 [Candidatus Brocadiaceae bacterium]|nr:hypothetical protein [Candidatus Brocadiaceae bacterium]